MCKVELSDLYSGRVPGFADLVCYWFEKAREQIEVGKAKRAGLLATNSIRGGVNREVLKRVKDTGDIFMAWSDRPWVLEGAAVRVSMVGFDDGDETIKTLDGDLITSIHPDLTGDVDLRAVSKLKENEDICFRSDEKGGPFDITDEAARTMLNATNISGFRNSDVVRPYVNGLDVTRRSRNMWVVDFGVDATKHEAAKYQKPFEYVTNEVKPIRLKVRNEREKRFWWLHRRPAPDMRIAISRIERFIAVPAVSKHRLFVWFDSQTIPDHQLYIFAREDDYFFGVLHSKLHEVWSLRMGTSLEDRPRYTPTTTFETFPFPWPPGYEDTASPAYQAISDAARQLHEERDVWLNPPNLSEKALKNRTLTNLYNALNAWRGLETIKVKPAAGDFAPRLDGLHQALDRAVCDAYGWHDMGGEGYDFNIYTDEGEEEILRRLLGLNLERAAHQE